MIYCLDKGFVFIHIPRTAGVSITTSISEAHRTAVCNTTSLRHLFGWQIRKRIGDHAWDRLFKFSVIRSPWEIVASDYRLTLRDAKIFQGSSPTCSGGWINRTRRLMESPGFEAFVRREYLGEFSGIVKGGFWRTWCQGKDGEDLGICPYRFDCLDKEWPHITKRCGLYGVELRRLNSAESDCGVWTPGLVDAIGDLCREDIERFGFRPPSEFSHSTE